MKNPLAALPLIVVLAGCGGGGGEEPPPPGRPAAIASVALEMAADANGLRPARVGLAQVANPRLVDQLIAIPAVEWFGEKGEAFRAAHPKAYYDDWEVVPGHVAGPFDLQVDEYVYAVLFCDTDAAGPPLRIEDDGALAVHVEPEGCEVHPIE